MFKRIIKKRKNNNQGNTYILVVATLSFLAVLVAAILVAVALCYRLKAYDINARDNFYFLEQAMDEIYAGVGADAMEHLNEAYDDTVEVLVYFDAASQSYVTMKNEEANVILKNSYIAKMKADNAYQTKDSIRAHLYSFMSNPYYNLSFDKKNNKVIISNSDIKIFTINNAMPKNHIFYEQALDILNTNIKWTRYKIGVLSLDRKKILISSGLFNSSILSICLGKMHTVSSFAPFKNSSMGVSRTIPLKSAGPVAPV